MVEDVVEFDLFKEMKIIKERLASFKEDFDILYETVVIMKAQSEEQQKGEGKIAEFAKATANAIAVVIDKSITEKVEQEVSNVVIDNTKVVSGTCGELAEPVEPRKKENKYV